MTIRVAINGYGRIGRNILRAHYEDRKKHDIQIVAINDLGDASINAHLTKYDTAHGKFPGTVAVDGDYLVINGDKIKVCAQRNPAELPWKELGVDVVLECTGFFTTKEKASAHIKGGAKKVIISAPAKGDCPTIVMGVNEGKYDAKLHDVVSNVGTRIETFFDNMNRVTATETVQHQTVSSSGTLRDPEIYKTEYAALIKPTPAGYLNVEEYRNGGSDPDQFPDHIATVGTPSLILIFHPRHANDVDRFAPRGLLRLATGKARAERARNQPARERVIQALRRSLPPFRTTGQEPQSVGGGLQQSRGQH
jgi:hypothetical protein